MDDINNFTVDEYLVMVQALSIWMSMLERDSHERYEEVASVYHKAVMHWKHAENNESYNYKSL